MFKCQKCKTFLVVVYDFYLTAKGKAEWDSMILIGLQPNATDEEIVEAMQRIDKVRHNIAKQYSRGKEKGKRPEPSLNEIWSPIIKKLQEQIVQEAKASGIV